MSLSPETLKKTLKELCKIIAHEVEADSCTVHLKLYDPSDLLSQSRPKENGAQTFQRDFDKRLLNHINDVRSRWGLNKGGESETKKETDEEKEERKVFYDSYWKPCSTTLGFPY